jgi:hypothetical protein
MPFLVRPDMFATLITGKCFITSKYLNIYNTFMFQC